MNEQTIINLLDDLQSRIEGPAYQLYEMAVHKVVLTSVVALITVGAFIVGALIVVFRYGMPQIREDGWRSRSKRSFDNDPSVATVATWISAFVVAVLIPVFAVWAVKLATADYQAVKEILYAVLP